MGVEVYKKKPFSTRKRGHYLHIIVQYPPPTPLYCLQYCAIYLLPRPPLLQYKILAISCKGQYLIRNGNCLIPIHTCSRPWDSVSHLLAGGARRDRSAVGVLLWVVSVVAGA